MPIDNEKGDYTEMNKDTLKRAIATEKLRQAANYGNDALGHLKRYRLTQESAADFERNDAKSACVRSLVRIWDARSHYLAAGGEKSAPEYQDAAGAFNRVAKVGGSLFDISAVLDDMKANDGARILDFEGFKHTTTPWGETTTRYIKLAA